MPDFDRNVVERSGGLLGRALLWAGSPTVNRHPELVWWRGADSGGLFSLWNDSRGPWLGSSAHNTNKSG